jgi:predicted metal-dependent hydrolase
MTKILAFVADLFFLSRIESVSETLGLQLETFDSLTALSLASAAPSPDRPGEALSGVDGALIRKLSTDRPGLLVFDLNNDAVPWRRWIALLKSSAATRRIPILAFGAHMDVEAMTAASSAGADEVVARSRFTSDLPNLLTKHIVRRDPAALAAACAEPLSDLAREGIALFNAGEYFESHEVLEHAWNADSSAARELYRAILQIAVAYLQIERRNYRGAVKMFLRVRQWIDPLPGRCRGVDVADLRANAMEIEAKLLELGETGIGRLDTSLFRPVRVLD